MHPMLEHPSPADLLGPLFRDVALKNVFPGVKRWADALPLRPIVEIVEAYGRLESRNKASLSAFVAEHFEIKDAGEIGAAPVTSGRSLLDHIDSLWPHLRRASIDQGPDSLLALENDYLVPGGIFNEIYYWDSYFTLLGFDDRQRDLKDAMVQNFAAMLRTYGRIPNGNRSYYLSRSQPPFFAWMVRLTQPKDEAAAAAAFLDELITEHRFWCADSQGVRQLTTGPLSGLNRYWDDRETPRDESYIADVECAQKSMRPLAETFRNIRAAAESGWDFSSRWFADRQSLHTIETTSIVPVDLNSILFGLEETIWLGAQRRGLTDLALRYRTIANHRKSMVQAHLWNAECGFFADFNLRSQALSEQQTAATLYPLFFGLATENQAHRVAEVVAANLLKSGGLVTSLAATGQQWDYPNGWAPLNWIAVRGLARYGHSALAKDVATRWLRTVRDVFRQTGKLLEKYDVVNARPGGGGEYPLQDGFGWTNGVTVALARDYPDVATDLGLGDPS